MKKQTVLITGASGGIGLATVEAFAAAGWQVAATSRELDETMFASLPAVKNYLLDVTSSATITTAFAAAIRDFGGIDVVVNNAGYGLDGVFEAMDDNQIQRQFETNVFGLMRVTREAIRVMRPAKNGTIIQIASMGGRLTFPLYSVYHASKWAVEGFTESLSFELRQFNIRVKIIEPGVIKTAFYGGSRIRAESSVQLGYETFVKQVEYSEQQAGQRGESPQAVAATILFAARSRSNRLRYAVGSPAPLLFVLRRLLPDTAFLWLVRKFFRI